MTKIANISVGGRNPVRIMGILNTSPESFYKKSINTTRTKIKNAVIQMENDGADFIDVGGMSTAPYLSTMISEKVESKRVLDAIKIIQNTTNLPISVDTCRSSVAKIALENDVEIINDISGLKYDKNMKDVISKFQPSLILCAYDSKIILGNSINSTKKLLKSSLKIAKDCHIPDKKIVLDPAIGFFRKTGKGKFFKCYGCHFDENNKLAMQDHTFALDQSTAINNFKIVSASGTFSGTFTLYGIA